MSRKPKSILEKMPQTTLFKQIGDICTAVTTIISAKELLEVSLRKTMELFSAQRGSIFILNSNGKNLTLKISEGMAQAEQQKMVKRLGEGIVGRVAKIKEPLVVDNISDDKRFKDYKARKSYKTTSFICAPLLIKDELIGVINIADKESGGHFTKDELQLLDFLSTQIALNYRRVQLYQKFKKIVKESKTLKSELGKSSKETSDLKNKVNLQEKLATIGKLAGGIAHEFNNPLDGVLRYTNLCLESVKDDDVVKGYLLEIKHGLNRMANIVKSLLACSRNENPSMQQVDPNSAIEQALDMMQSEVYYKHITFEKELSDNLPSIMDMGLERVVSNLLRNAVDAVDRNGKIKVISKNMGNAIFIQVKDNGAGISEEIADKVFEPFYTTKDIEKGCGLGLTIVSEIVKSYDGQVKVESEPKKGTTFTVSIPLN